MIIVSQFSIIYWNEFSIDHQLYLTGLNCFEELTKSFVSFNTHIEYPNDEALAKALEQIRDHKNIEVINASSVDLAISFHYSHQCTLGFSKDDLNDLYKLVDQLSIDCYEVSGTTNQPLSKRGP